MKSKNHELPEEPKTPHEEVMFVVESTNEIVSEYNSCLIRMMEKIESTNYIVSKILDMMEKLKKYRELSPKEEQIRLELKKSDSL